MRLGNNPASSAPPQHAERWFGYYQKGFLPWDSHVGSKQLAYYLCSPCICELLDKGGTSNTRSKAGQKLVPQPAGWNLSYSEDSIVLVHHPMTEPPSASTARHSNYPASASALGSTAQHCTACSRYRPQPQHTSMLELGCGTGASAVMAAQLGYSVVGVDIVPAAIEAAEAAATQAGLAPGNSSKGELGRHACSALFLQHDIFALPKPFSPAAAHRLKTSAEEAQDAEEKKELFNFVYDCQSYHVLRQVDETSYMHLLTSSLAPDGFLLLLAGAATESPITKDTASPITKDTASQPHAGKAPEPSEPQPQPLGPPQMTAQQLKDAFKQPDWEWLWLVKTRFDETEYYREAFPQPPLAWWGLLQRTSRHSSGEAQCNKLNAA